ncbi:hypothetical protein Trydic_g4015 [Trypoxylus dichotomus]
MHTSDDMVAGGLVKMAASPGVSRIQIQLCVPLHFLVNTGAYLFLHGHLHIVLSGLRGWKEDLRRYLIKSEYTKKRGLRERIIMFPAIPLRTNVCDVGQEGR